MTPAYARRYTIPGHSGEVTGVTLTEPVPEGYLPVVWAQGPVVLVPVAALTEVDTTPEEPGPGVYFIGDDGEAWQRFEDRDDEQRWCGVGYEPLCTWAEVWAHTAGRPQRVPDTTIRRLVPEPVPLELPWGLTGTVSVELATGCGCFGEEDGERLIRVAAGDGSTRIKPDVAEQAGWALLAAARAAREVAP